MLMGMIRGDQGTEKYIPRLAPDEFLEYRVPEAPTWGTSAKAEGREPTAKDLKK